MRTQILFLISLSILIAISCGQAEDKVLNLYGDLYKGDVFSGYLSTNDEARKLHYIFIPSQEDQYSDPVVLWLNGGPGCSSLLGLFMENGPVVLDDYDSEWKINDFSWNKNANMLYIEMPAGVGFSYTTKDQEDLISDDSKSALDNEKALVDFFNRFPAYKQSPFYISGESYAGVYVPWLAKTILEKKDGIQLKGILLGNGLTDVAVDVEEGLIDFAFYHTLYSQDVYDRFNLLCNDNNNKFNHHERNLKEKKFGDFHPKNVTKACNNVRQEIKDSLNGLNIYDIYKPCPPRTSNNTETFGYQKATINSMKSMNKLKMYKKKLEKFGSDFSENLEPELHIWPDGCDGDMNLDTFLNDNGTKAALHVNQNITWSQCSEFINENYKTGEASYSIYKDVLITNNDMRVWFYSGDTDAAVPFTGSIKWIPRLGMNITEQYRPWIVNEQVAGYVQGYGNNFKYITLKGTGHMAPQWKREESFIMFEAFLKGEELPKRNSTFN